MTCPALEGRRNYDLIDKRITDPIQRMITLLFKQNKHQEVGNMLKNLWDRRKAILKFREEELERMDRNNNNIIGIARSDPGPAGNSHIPIRRSRGLSATRG